MKTEAEEDLLLVGIGVSPGIAIGQALVVAGPAPAAQNQTITPDEVEREIEALHRAIGVSRSQLEEVRRQAEAEASAESLAIIDAHLLILDDQMLVGDTEEVIRRELVGALGAMQLTLQRIRQTFERINDEYLRERGSDVEFVGQRIMRNLTGQEGLPAAEIHGHGVLVAHDLSPADTLQLNRKKVIAFITDGGGRTSHTAILARSLGIPAVVGLASATRLVGQHVPVIVDGGSGVVVINPSHASFREYLARKQQFEYEEAELSALRNLPAETTDGFHVALRANLDHPDEVHQARSRGAEGVGLMRTEFLFMNRETPPDEEEQLKIYRAMARKMEPQPVTIRTLDVGGDKLVPEIDLAGEDNPALGLRAVRFSLKEERLFRVQLRAILRASACGRVRLMFPMISGVAELRACRALLREVMAELTEERHPFDPQIPVGTIIEIPAAAMIADRLAAEVDFFSIGTNDLIQYTLAVDRGNEQVAYLYDPLHPAVLRLLRQVCDAADAAGIPVGMCGEMAAEPLFALLLAGLGLTELSMNPADIPRMKRALRRMERREGRELVRQFCDLATGEEAQRALESEMRRRFPELFPALHL